IRAAAAVGPVNCYAGKKRFITGETVSRRNDAKQQQEDQSFHSALRRAERISGSIGPAVAVPSALTRASNFFNSGNFAVRVSFLGTSATIAFDSTRDPAGTTRTVMKCGYRLSQESAASFDSKNR